MFICHLVVCSSGRIQKLHACVQFPAAEASGVRGVLRLLGSARQRPSVGRSLWREAPPGLHPDPREAGPAEGPRCCFLPFFFSQTLTMFTDIFQSDRDLMCRQSRSLIQMDLAFSICLENGGGQAGEEKPGSHKKTRRKGERGKNEEEVCFCSDVLNTFTCTMLMPALLALMCVFTMFVFCFFQDQIT